VSVGKVHGEKFPILVDLSDILEKPRVESRKRLAALLNQSKGSEVITPAPTNRRVVDRTQMPHSRYGPVSNEY